MGWSRRDSNIRIAQWLPGRRADSSNIEGSINSNTHTAPAFLHLQQKSHFCQIRPPAASIYRSHKWPLSARTAVNIYLYLHVLNAREPKLNGS